VKSAGPAQRQATQLRDLEGKIAVITGAASGIGHALTRRCIAEGMKVVLADIEAAALTAVEVEAREAGASVLGVLTDVSNPKHLERLADRTLSSYGAVHLLFNNAGVGMIGPRVWEGTIEDWTWILGVNLWGVIHGLRAFVPIMIEQGTECHIVNTASAAGLVLPPGMGVYNASKAAVIALSETLQHELIRERLPLRVSVVCPGMVQTRLVDAERNRPSALKNDPCVEAERRSRCAAGEEELRKAAEQGLPAQSVAVEILTAVRESRLHVFTHSWVKETFEQRVDNLLRGIEPWTGSSSSTSEAS
jgi:NAD(P)-dependent dehydrogenase (short-subunit alcohol dehydrogenase family)